jgi:hypothetical protein
VPFLDYDVEIRRVICSTNAIESINARYRRAVRAREHFPNDTAALKCLYLVTRSRPDRTRQSTLGDEMKARTQRIRDHFPRKNQLNHQANPPLIGHSRVLQSGVQCLVNCAHNPPPISHLSRAR